MNSPFSASTPAAFATILAAFVLNPAPADAGLLGQPAPTVSVAATIRAESKNILKGQIATGRPNLFLIIQTNAQTDFTDLVARVIGDDTTYEGLVSTLEEAVSDAKSDPDRQFAVYNLARLHLLRSQLIRPGFDRRPALDAAGLAANKFGRDLPDPRAWELKGDIAAERGDVTGALADYRGMLERGAPPAEVQYKSGWTYERAHRIALAESAYNAALLAQATSGAGGAPLKHLIYQGLARTAISQGNFPAALRALAKSALVGQDESAPFAYRLDAAYSLLKRGYAREVLSFANAALAASPDDPNAQTLRDQAASAARRR